ncbi:MAG: V-type ATPase subunit [bacterium]
MLKAAIQYAYINAKIRALKSRMLCGADYENLLGVSGYCGMAECLKTTWYGAALSQFPASFDGLIRLFYQDLFDCYGKVILSLSGNRKLLIQHLYQKYELENLKAILRIICQAKPKESMEQLLLPTGERQSFSPQALLQAGSLEEVLLKLKGTGYYRPLKNAFHRFEEEKETFPLEMALDLSYYSHLWKIVSSLGRRDQKIVKSILGVQMDVLNITWIFRFKEIYHFSPEEILNYGLTQGRYISSELRKKMAYSVDRKDAVAHLTGTPYKALLTDPASATVEDNPEACSIQLWRYLLAVIKKNWQGFPFHIGIILDYVLFREIEVKDLVSITEAKRMNLSRELVSKYLIQTVPYD